MGAEITQEKLNEILEAVCNAVEGFEGLEGFNDERKNLEFYTLAVMIDRVDCWAKNRRACEPGIDSIVAGILDTALDKAADATDSRPEVEEASILALKQIAAERHFDWKDLLELAQPNRKGA